jgi:hypothetical protein
MLDGNTQQTQSVSCTQNQWDMTIDASAESGRARVLLQLGGPKPVVRTVNIENVNHTSGVAGSGVGEAEASADGDTYTVVGTAVGSDSANSSQKRSMRFEIKAPC